MDTTLFLIGYPSRLGRLRPGGSQSEQLLSALAFPKLFQLESSTSSTCRLSPYSSWTSRNEASQPTTCGSSTFSCYLCPRLQEAWWASGPQPHCASWSPPHLLFLAAWVPPGLDSSPRSLARRLSFIPYPGCCLRLHWSQVYSERSYLQWNLPVLCTSLGNLAKAYKTAPLPLKIPLCPFAVKCSLPLSYTPSPLCPFVDNPTPSLWQPLTCFLFLLFGHFQAVL